MSGRARGRRRFGRKTFGRQNLKKKHGRRIRSYGVSRGGVRL